MENGVANDADDEAIAIKVGGPIVAAPPIAFITVQNRPSKGSRISGE